MYEKRITATSQVWNTFISIVHIYFNIWHWVQIIPLCHCPLRYPGKCGKYPHKYVENKHLNNCFFVAIPFECLWETSTNCISSMFYFVCSNITATKIKYKFDILTRMTAVLVTQRTSLYENNTIIYWKCDLFSFKYIFLCA